MTAKRSWFVPPETDTLRVCGESVVVKRRLNEGERRELLRQAYRETEAGIKVNLDAVGGFAEALVYIVAWTVPDDTGAIVPMETLEERRAALENMDPAVFRELSSALQAHIDRHADLKKTDQGAIAPGSEPISGSVD